MPPNFQNEHCAQTSTAEHTNSAEQELELWGLLFVERNDERAGSPTILLVQTQDNSTAGGGVHENCRKLGDIPPQKMN